MPLTHHAIICFQFPFILCQVPQLFHGSWWTEDTVLGNVSSTQFHVQWGKCAQCVDRFLNWVKGPTWNMSIYVSHCSLTHIYLLTAPHPPPTHLPVLFSLSSLARYRPVCKLISYWGQAGNRNEQGGPGLREGRKWWKLRGTWELRRPYLREAAASESYLPAFKGDLSC